MEHVDDAVLGLSRFAYETLPSSRAPDPPPSRPAPLASKDPPDHLPDSQLTQLSRCIGCGLEWTSRKTAKQKRTHIKLCAKKHALTKDTIRILIQNETAALSPSLNPSSRDDTTLMDSVVPTSTIKKSKRHQVLPTVRPLPETRDSILARAKDILGPTNGQTDPQLTQQFGQSALACRNTQHPERQALLDVNRSAEEPPSTQPFGASSLGGITAERSGDSCEESACLQLGPSSFARQGAVVSNERRKRSASPPPPVANNSRIVRRRVIPTRAVDALT
ncbi:hypothetical protein HD554DRAFT_2049167 [Boletus coccyginus]|nr:hypothetical protein HD554DRAFT_2049167 [Boletus coccyginus]